VKRTGCPDAGQFATDFVVGDLWNNNVDSPREQVVKPAAALVTQDRFHDRNQLLASKQDLEPEPKPTTAHRFQGNYPRPRKTGLKCLATKHSSDGR
jgi:hypothetical protein